GLAGASRLGGPARCARGQRRGLPGGAAGGVATMSTLVVVTGVPAAGKTGLATALAERLGVALVSLDEIKEELAVEAEDTPREWLREDAESELVRRIEAFDGEAVVDIWIAPRRDTERIRDLLKR